jgi:wyosine [tRNA(Phe)-imidazoG37] synthetase (radical SAM superfamily)
VYCQLGKIQKITTESKVYVPSELIIEDLRELEASEAFVYDDLDVITFAGSGEPTLATNLAEIITQINKLFADRTHQVPISILTNATTLEDPRVRSALLSADLISLKLDAYNDEMLKAINQPAPNISIASITNGIKLLQADCANLPKPRLQLQIMLMPKHLEQDKNYAINLAKLILELKINHIQLNTPTRPKPISKSGEFWIDTRGNHYAPSDPNQQVPDYIEFRDLPVVSKEQAFMIEDELESILRPQMPNLSIINIFKRES